MKEKQRNDELTAQKKKTDMVQEELLSLKRDLNNSQRKEQEAIKKIQEETENKLET